MIPPAPRPAIAGLPVLFVIDDEPAIPSQVEGAVQATGFRTIARRHAREAIEILRSQPADVALVDLQTSGSDGLDVLREIREVQPQCGVILMTAHASPERAIEAVKQGALDYLTKPLDVERLQRLLADARDDRERRAALMAAESDLARRLELRGVIGRSAVMQQLFGFVRRIAPHARVTLVTGETGTGKRSIARALHDLGPRRQQRFVAIGCTGIVETLFDSELFGGTVFLDEIGALPPAAQARLLDVIESGELHRVGTGHAKNVDVRLVVSTSRDLRAEVEAGRFRSDLFDGLADVALNLPPLRERREDIPYLTAAFVKEFAARFERPIQDVTPGAERILMGHRWSGNVRELRSVLERACQAAVGRTLTERDLESMIPIAPIPALLTGRELGTMERDHIVRVLNEVRGNKRAAAERLGISRRTLYRRLERHGLS